MKPSEQRLSEARRQHTEAIVAQHVHQLFQRLPRLSAAVDEGTVDRIIRAESDHARFVAGLVVWQRGELRQEIERGVVRAPARRAPRAAEAEPGPVGRAGAPLAAAREEHPARSAL